MTLALTMLFVLATGAQGEAFHLAESNSRGLIAIIAERQGRSDIPEIDAGPDSALAPKQGIAVFAQAKTPFDDKENCLPLVAAVAQYSHPNQPCHPGFLPWGSRLGSAEMTRCEYRAGKKGFQQSERVLNAGFGPVMTEVRRYR